MTDTDSDSGSTTTTYFDGGWKDAVCFKDLLHKTRMFVCGHLSETPVNLAPLNAESAVILPQLKTLNTLGVMTVSSQPAFEATTCRQRGYVEGFWEGPIDEFATRVLEHTDLEVFATDGNRIMSDLTAPHDDRWAWTQMRTDADSEWHTCTGMMLDSLLDKTESRYYDTPDYQLSTDPALVRFVVCDPEYGDSPTSCCDHLVRAMS